MPSPCRLNHRRDLRNGLDFRRYSKRTDVDFRQYRLFHSDPKLDCCPTLTELAYRVTGVNQQGLVLELFTTENETQSFYETFCHPAIKNRPCQYIDHRVYKSQCTQHYSYNTAIGRTFGNFYEQFRVDKIRVASGCKCQVLKKYIRKRNDVDMMKRKLTFCKMICPIRSTKDSLNVQKTDSKDED